MKGHYSLDEFLQAFFLALLRIQRESLGQVHPEIFLNYWTNLDNLNGVFQKAFQNEKFVMVLDLVKNTKVLANLSMSKKTPSHPVPKIDKN